MTEGILYIVATPIGNMEDITLRALRVLADCDFVAAEDTRRTRALLSRHGLARPLIALHEHNEEKQAPALIESIRSGELQDTQGPVSSMGRLDCKTPSMVALNGLARDADVFATISEEEAAAGVRTLAEYGYATTPSGGAGLAALLAGRVKDLGPDARVLAILSEGPEDG